MRTLRNSATVALLLVALPGCAPEMFAPPAEAIISPQSKYVKTAGACLDLSATQKSTLNREEFLGKVQEMLQSDRRVAAAMYVRRHPDYALDTLRTIGCAEAAKPTVQFVARIYDESCKPQGHITQCVFGSEGISSSKSPTTFDDQLWLSVLNDRIARPEKYRDYDLNCVKLREHQRNGRHAEAAKIAASLQPPTKLLLENDARRISAEALLLADRPEEAAKVLAASMKPPRLPSQQPHQLVHLLLLYGEAQRRAGQKGDADITWSEAAIRGWMLAHATRPYGDPAAWERIASLRPAHLDWPVTSPTEQLGTLNEAWVFKQIGQWRLERGEAQAALAALKRAETLTADPKARDQYQLLQAQALIQLNQRAAALTTLARLAENPSADVTAPALAMLGAIKHFEGNKAQALALFEKAFELNPNGEWFMRAQAEADLGYLYLMRGDDAKGLQALHRAQDRFELNREDDQLVQCLTNEAAYLDQKGMNDQALQIRQRLQNLQRG